MEKIPTAEEFLRESQSNPSKGWTTRKLMIEFAKLHVELQASSILKSVRIIDDPNSYCGNTGSEYPPNQIIDRNSILNSYPLENIK
jgi:hypothetical protein